MTYLVERLAELRRHLDHLRELRPRVRGGETLRRDLSLSNDADAGSGPGTRVAGGALLTTPSAASARR
jgi:hypothetical protein